MSRDGAFSSRRGTGEGLLPAPSELILPRSIRAATLSPCTFQPNASANCGATQLTPNDRRGACGAAASSVQHSAAHAAWKTGLSIFAALNVDRPSSLREEDFLRTLGISWKRMPNGLVMNDREEFVRRVREAITCSRELTPHPSRSGW